MLKNTNWSALQQEKTLPVLLQQGHECLQRCGTWPLIKQDIKTACNVSRVQRSQYWPFFPAFDSCSRVEWSCFAAKTPHLSLTKGRYLCYEGYKAPVQDHWTRAHRCPFGLCSSPVRPLYSYCHDVLRALGEMAFFWGSDIVRRQLFWAVQKVNHSINISNLAQICHWQKKCHMRVGNAKAFTLSVMWKGIFLHQDNCLGVKSGSNKGQWSTWGHCFYHKVISQDHLYRPFTGPKLAI